jgi:dolichyl-phosphate-mannose--protein O-mannosyl transferase
MFYEGSDRGENGCGYDVCSAAITSIGNPLIWWASTAALFYLVYRLARYREWRVGLILMGMVAGYLPWLMYLNRTVFQFYTIAFEPYLLLGLTFCIGVIAKKVAAPGRGPDLTASLTNDATAVSASRLYRGAVGVRFIIIFLIVATLLSAFFYPLWTGSQTSYDFWRLHTWMESWR